MESIEESKQMCPESPEKMSNNSNTSQQMEVLQNESIEIQAGKWNAMEDKKEERKFQCNFCPAAFKAKYKLNRHEITQW